MHITKGGIKMRKYKILLIVFSFFLISLSLYSCEITPQTDVISGNNLYPNHPLTIKYQCDRNQELENVTMKIMYGSLYAWEYLQFKEESKQAYIDEGHTDLSKWNYTSRYSIIVYNPADFDNGIIPPDVFHDQIWSNQTNQSYTGKNYLICNIMDESQFFDRNYQTEIISEYTLSHEMDVQLDKQLFKKSSGVIYICLYNLVKYEDAEEEILYNFACVRYSISNEKVVLSSTDKTSK